VKEIHQDGEANPGQEFIDGAEAEAETERVGHRAKMREIKEYAASYEGKIRTKETLHDALDDEK